ncbi:TNF receptor-associated factor 2-like isoform X1 [Brienomyrus brachyistius]|uniref:TNF receptor-associated factor 2-like isoform X1 n=1 Tax=Brienomyrus brachyistius TaxID=42636 RepID=UPI0020B3C510|nr:TNF receptor-associated factor 2-like isoform X1 [Brienomyrus brachyistius]XP_048855489.1 TNF receptor-associated factor 2-like isoform X1 [Brienomyrus brachyistius]XP_048855490.1 TNF receptor-associated factor 2-like isoform X1 [Brienomyrus brachyistius]
MACSSLARSPDSSMRGIPQSVLMVSMETKYQCQHCDGVLRVPFQARCGHRFCGNCFRELTGLGPLPCKVCQRDGIFEDPLSILNTSDAFPDNAARREIENLPAQCPSKGCPWRGVVKDYEAQHEGRCEHEQVQCEACQAFVPWLHMARHTSRECEARTVTCKFCKATFSSKDIKGHNNVCQKFPIHCESCGKKKIPREMFADHSNSCGKQQEACQFSTVGCETSLENERQGDHEQANVLEHMRLLLAKVVVLLKHDASGPAECEEGAALGLYRAPADEEVGANNSLQPKVAALENIVCVLNREVERCAFTLEAFTCQQRLDQQQMETLKNKIQQLERSLAMRDLQLAEAEQVLHELAVCTYDGVFVWKITNFSRRREEAVSSLAPTMFSPAFYSSKYGYKMCLRLYLNGDGTGRGTHLSLFFVVMRGKYDGLLKWPFSQKVTLMLLDQNNREHVIDAFRPDISSTSFQRPISEMNIASGCPLFCPLAKLGGKSVYLKDDTIFIKAVVDLTGLQ